ncbi:MAG: 16S rRNA (guanine(527)-N(7))-methyltransferase RsmG [Ruminococcus sp.]|nr:16S rRNA (guanine(527)-N(7))-methyltransferase RsmG [Ruminococcus sp.]
MKEYLISAIDNYKISLSDEQIDQLQGYYEMLIEWNQKMNLTAITDPKEVAIKHFADSLSIFNYIDLPQNARVIDVGTGAGFPGVVMKIARPDLELTLLDSLKKRLVFLESVLNKLGLSSELIHDRAENAAQNIDLREGFDLAISRAVARMNVLSEYCLPFVKLSGHFAAMKGPDAQSEIQAAKNAIQILGGKIFKINEFELYENGGGRTIVLVEKIRPTPEKYPRNSGKIKSNPL